MSNPTYTHKALIAAGYVRQNPDPIRGVGFVCYIRDANPTQVVFAGNNATMGAWTEEHWKNWPALLKWWHDPTRRAPYVWKEWLFHFVFIKGEDPLISSGE